MKKTNQEKSFTLLEAIVAIFVITTGVIGVYSLIIQTLSASNSSKEKLIAAYLAQEGIEIVRNIRDTNWVAKQTDPTRNWDTGLEIIGIYEADYQSPKLYLYSDNHYLDHYLDIGVSGYYYYSSFPSVQTKFQRKITISAKDDTNGDGVLDRMTVRVKVSWGTNTVKVQEYLYSWYSE
jgi:type II secretory pathway pseudopilin PulG